MPCDAERLRTCDGLMGTNPGGHLWDATLPPAARSVRFDDRKQFVSGGVGAGARPGRRCHARSRQGPGRPAHLLALHRPPRPGQGRMGVTLMSTALAVPPTAYAATPVAEAGG